jgi:hypothetical protein
VFGVGRPPEVTAVRALKIAAVLLCGVAAGALLWDRHLRPEPTWALHVRSGFRDMPGGTADRAMEAWLGGQPGVTRATVTRDEKGIRIVYEFRGRSPDKAPGVTGKLRELGYHGPVEFTSWHDRE